MKNKKILIPLIAVAVIALAVFGVNRYNTHKRNEVALETIYSAISNNYVFVGTDETEYLDIEYVFKFKDRDTVEVEYTSRGSGGNINTNLKQDFDYRIFVEEGEFQLKVGKPKNIISSVYSVAKLAPSSGTFKLKSCSYEGEGYYNAISGIKMKIENTVNDTMYLDLKTPDTGSRTIMLPEDVELD